MHTGCKSRGGGSSDFCLGGQGSPEQCLGREGGVPYFRGVFDFLISFFENLPGGVRGGGTGLFQAPFPIFSLNLTFFLLSFNRETYRNYWRCHLWTWFCFHLEITNSLNNLKWSKNKWWITLSKVFWQSDLWNKKITLLKVPMALAPMVSKNPRPLLLKYNWIFLVYNPFFVKTMTAI